MDLFTTPHIDSKQCNLYILSDIHCGCEYWQEPLLQNDINNIQTDPNARVVIPGDLFQRDLKNHKVGNVYHQAIPPSNQKYYMRDLLKPIADKILGIISGNHDDRGQEDDTSVKDLCEFIGVRYFGDEICISIPVGKGVNGKPLIYTGYGIHGCSNGSTVGAVSNALAKLPSVCDADFYFMGHSHQPVTFPLQWYRRDLHNKNMTPIIRQFVAGGSYQGREKYPITKAMTPKILGCPIIRLSGTQKEMTVILPNKAR